MTRSHKRGRIAALVAIAFGALALLALPGVAAAKAKDRNHDHIPDRWERKHKLSLKVNQARRDQDHDGLRNRAEFRAGTNPRNADSNHDGVKDGEENAGTIVSFDAETGKLTIDLFGGDTISGFVTEETEIECGCGHHPSSGEGEEEAVPFRARSNDGEESEDDGPNHDLGDDHSGEEGPDQEGEHQSSGCSTEDLVAGAVIKEAELNVSGGRAVFEKIEFGRES